MGTCTLCGQRAGWFKTDHEECLSRREMAWTSMIELAERGLDTSVDVHQLEGGLQSVATENFMDSGKARKALVSVWEGAVTQFLEDGLLTIEEETRLTNFKDRFSLDQSDLDAAGAFSRLVKAGALRDLTEGKFPERMTITGTLPIRLQKSERIIWVFPNTEYFEDRTKREYVGQHSGVSLRVVKGVYYRIGGFRGHPIERTERTHIDTGVFVVTTKHLYFAGNKKSLRIPYQKIISLIPFSDGIGVHRDAATAKPQIFVTGDGWFTYNLLANVKHLTD